ncbi:PX domain-containing protein EREL1 isoform X2 [Capsella rubella]|nr:PX domain-containing protein EREL1 isoform X2 [Capsella rubella]
MRGVLRRFNDFLKLLTDLKRTFPRKSFPSAPPKGLLRMKSRAVLEERRCSLEEWITKLLSDIELARSVVVASFLELEAAARSACQDVDQNASDANNDRNSTSSSPMVHPNLSLFHAGGSSLTSDYGSDTAYETSELGSPSLGHDDISEIGTEDLTLDEDITNPIEKLVNFSMSNIDEGLSMSQTILEQLEDFPKHKARSRYVNNILGKDAYNGNASKGVFFANSGSRLLSAPESSLSVMHDRKLSVESADGFALHTGETSTSGLLSSSSDIYLDLPRGPAVSLGTGLGGNSERQGSAQIVLPLELRNKLNRILLATNERLVNAKTDMEDLIARLNQEIAVKDYLNKKVDDLEGELETTKQRSKENLEQAIMSERERLNQMQWDMEELRQKSYEMEMKLKKEEVGSSLAEPTEQSTISESHVFSKELDAKKQQLEDLSRRYEELEAKSKADIKVLVKEVKALRRSHVELEKELTQSLMDKTEAEKLLQQERKLLENTVASRKKLLSDCRILHDRLKDYNLNFSIDGNGNFTEDSTTVSDALRLLSISDDQIEEAQLLAGFDENAAAQDIDKSLSIDAETRIMEDELRKILANIFVQNAKLRKQVNSAMLRALQKDIKTNEDVNEVNGDEKEVASTETLKR